LDTCGWAKTTAAEAAAPTGAAAALGADLSIMKDAAVLKGHHIALFRSDQSTHQNLVHLALCDSYSTPHHSLQLCVLPPPQNRFYTRLIKDSEGVNEAETGSVTHLLVDRNATEQDADFAKKVSLCSSVIGRRKSDHTT
jgi:hypothetical protein